MPATSLNVDLLSMTPDADALIYAAARQCYSADYAPNTFKHEVFDAEENNNLRQDHRHKLILKVVGSGHTSVLEHVSFSFAISGISRALSHQLVRHRIASYSQQSQRYVKADHFGFEYVLPPSIAKSDARTLEGFGGYVVSKSAVNAFNVAMDAARNAYDALVACGIPAEDARYVLPNACETKVVTTMNCRALLNFFELRCCNRAQWEIRAMAKAMLAICQDKLPVVFAKAGARCKRLGHCPEANPCRQHREAMERGGA